MSSEVEIANRALQHVKVSKRISSRSQGTKEANAIDEVFDEVRDNLLDLHNWNFATKRVKLARLATTPAFEWDYEYQLPALFLRAVSVSDNSTHRGHVAYQLEGGKLLSDASDIYLVYIAQITDPNQMPPTFRAAFSRYLADCPRCGAVYCFGAGLVRAVPRRGVASCPVDRQRAR